MGRFFQNYSRSTDFSVGKDLKIIEDKVGEQNYFFEPSICYEAIFQTFSDSESQFLINITNDAGSVMVLVQNNIYLPKYSDQLKNQPI